MIWVPPATLDAGEAFRARLFGFVRTWTDGKTRVLYDPAPPAYPTALRRMLERLTLGLSADNEGPGVGQFKAPRVLLVGDRPGPGGGVLAPNWPFISGLRTGCSAWLAEQLESAGVPESQLYWVNAFDARGKPTDGAFAARLGAPLVIALGTNAFTWCVTHIPMSHDYKVERVHHPQYWKRFHAKHTYRLTQLLKPKGRTHGTR